jgi:hypothetical protein
VRKEYGSMRIENKGFVLLALALLFLSIRESSATGVLVNPPAITVLTEEDFTFSIDIENVDNLIAYQIRLNWTPSILNMINVNEGTFLNSSGSSTSFGVTWKSTGTFIAISNIEDQWSPGTSGSGTLFDCLFNSTDILGQSALKLCDTRLFNASYTLVDTPPYLGDCTNHTGGAPDMIVDYWDTKLVVECINSQDYYAPADFNSDGVVDYYDFMCCYWNYGTVYGPGVKARQPVEITHELHDGNVKVAQGVGGVVIAIDKFGLLTPYIGFSAITLIAGVAAITYLRRVKHRKERAIKC